MIIVCNLRTLLVDQKQGETVPLNPLRSVNFMNFYYFLSNLSGTLLFSNLSIIISYMVSML